MLFNSINYFIFLIISVTANYLSPYRFRWLVLLFASISFYLTAGAITFVVPVVIVLSTYIFGIQIEKYSNIRIKQACFIVGLSVNLGLLIFFKYINFLIATVSEFINFIFNLPGPGRNENVLAPSILHLIVPLGISYISFQAIGYLIEIKRGDQNAEKHVGLFATYLFFFPKLLSGPVERAHDFLPQLRQNHSFNYQQFLEGWKRILWGLFKKLVIANRLAIYTDAVFNNSGHHSGITLLVASVFYTVQLFADFSGYSDMAIGSAQILGYRLTENFNNPFSAKSVKEFWRKWHISLTTWVNEYIFNPIVFNFRKWNKWGIAYAGMVTFLILGFWHGASWNYIIFGFLQGTVLAIEFFTNKIRKKGRNLIPGWINTVLSFAFIFSFFSFSFLFFRVKSVGEAFFITKKIFTTNGSLFIDINTMIYGVAGISFLSFIGWLGYKNNYGSLPIRTKYWFKEQLFYCLLIFLTLAVGVFDGGQFIYFQF